MKDIYLLFTLLLLVIVMVLFTYITPIPPPIPTIPQCHEDVVLVGVGDFENGRWDSYTCGPAVDD